MRGIFLFELALLTPMVILAATSLFDITTVIRTKNALKEAAQASIRCLTTEGSLCSTTIEQAPLTRLYKYYRQTTPPPLFGNLRQVPVRINERVSPLRRYQFDATVLDAVYTGAQQTQYEEVSLTRPVTKVVPYVLQSFPYFVMPKGPGNYDIFGQPAGQSAATADREVTTFGGAVTKTTGRSVVFSIPKPKILEGFGAKDICSRNIIRDGVEKPEDCLLSQNGSTLLSSMMLVFDGDASGGLKKPVEKVKLNISASYYLRKGGKPTVISLGGQEFDLNGTQRAENFLPRGAPIDQVSKGLSSKPELKKYEAGVVILPFDTDITVTVKFAEKPDPLNATWTPIKLRVFIPSFEQKKANLSCSEKPSCMTMAESGTSACSTTPNINPPKATLKLGTPSTVSSTPPKVSQCLPNATSPISLPQPTTYSINKQFCADNALRQVTSSSCPAQITKHQCNGSNKGVATPPNTNGIITGSPDSLSNACNSSSSTTPASLPAGTSLTAGEAFATVKTFRIMAGAGKPAESKSWQQSCDPNSEKARVARPVAVTPYAQVTPVLVSTVDGQLQSLPVQSAGTTQQSLSCFPTRELSPSRDTNIYSALLRDYAYILSPHPDKGCAYEGILMSAKNQVEKDPRYQATVGSPITTGRFELPSGSKPDACTPFTVGTSTVDKDSLHLIGTFPKTAPPPECADGNCVTEFVGFSRDTSTDEPSLNLQQAVNEAEAAALAYLPNRSREDLTVTITPPSRSTIGPKTYEVTTSMTVPLSFGRKSAITHVSHGQAEG
jgi:hypothetical protein